MGGFINILVMYKKAVGLGWVRGGRITCLVQYICFPCKKIYIENKKNYDGFKLAGKLLLFFHFSISLHGEN